MDDTNHCYKQKNIMFYFFPRCLKIWVNIYVNAEVNFKVFWQFYVFQSTTSSVRNSVAYTNLNNFVELKISL